MLFLSSLQLVGLEWGGVGPGVWAAVGYSAAFATAFAFVGWQRGISRIGANRMLVYQYLITFVGVTSGSVFFGETLGVEKSSAEPSSSSSTSPGASEARSGAREPCCAGPSPRVLPDPAVSPNQVGDDRVAVVEALVDLVGGVDHVKEGQD